MKTARHVKAEILRALAEEADAGFGTQEEFAAAAGACGKKRIHLMTAAQFRAIRQECGVSQQKLAGILGISDSSVSLYELGRIVVPGPVALLMHIAQKRGLDELLV